MAAILMFIAKITKKTDDMEKSHQTLFFSTFNFLAGFPLLCEL